MKVNILTFGFRHGEPKVDIVIDCRGLRNPHRNKRLRYLCGLDKPVIQEVKGTPGFDGLLRRAVELTCGLERDVVNVGVGCFGGKHRAVVVGEALKSELEKRGIEVDVSHTSPAMGG